MSGASVTFLLKKGSALYCANVGNVLAFVFFSEKIFSYKFDVRQLTYNNSNFNSETLVENSKEIEKLNNHNLLSLNKNNNYETENMKNLHSSKKINLNNNTEDNQDFNKQSKKN